MIFIALYLFGLIGTMVFSVFADMTDDEALIYMILWPLVMPITLAALCRNNLKALLFPKPPSNKELQ